MHGRDWRSMKAWRDWANRTDSSIQPVIVTGTEIRLSGVSCDKLVRLPADAIQLGLWKDLMMLDFRDDTPTKDVGFMFIRKADGFSEIADPELMVCIGNYITTLETKETMKVCKCVWEMHPDDVNKTEGRRFALKEHNLQCPVHSREGFLLGFVSFMKAYNG